MTFVLDTNAVILVLKGEARTIIGETDTVAISIISEIELLGWKGLSRSEELAVRGFLVGARVLPLSEAVKDAAIKLRSATNLKTPDAIIAATASVLGAVLVTNDKQLLRVPGLRTQQLVRAE